MTNQLFKSLLWCCMATGSLLLAGCSTDEDIDVGDVDTTLGLGTDELNAPASSTKPVPLSDILDIDDSDCIFTDERGDYKFVKDGGDIAPTSTQINPVKVNTGEGITDIPYIIPASDLIPEDILPSAARAMKKVESIKELKHTITAFTFHQSDLSGDIVELKQANTTPTKVKLTVTFSNDLAKLLSSFTGIQLQLPTFLHFKDNQLNWTNGSNSGTTTVTNGLVSVGQVNTGQNFILEGLVNALEFGGERIVSESDAEKYCELLYDHDSRTIDMNGFIDIRIKFDEANITINLDELANINQKEFRIDSKLEFGNWDSASGGTVINLASVEGQFKPEIDFTIDAVEITGIPDFLNDDDVSINIHNVILTLNIESTLPLTGIIDGTLHAYYTNQAGELNVTHLTVKGMKVLPSQTSNIVICRQGTAADNVFIARDGQDPRVTGDIGDLLKHIPDSITFDCSATTLDGETATLPLGQDFTFKPSYSFEAPLSLDTGSTIIYDDKVDDWNKDLNKDDVSVYENVYIEVKGNVQNNTPLTLIADRLVVLDMNGNEVSGAKADFVNEQGAVQPNFRAVHNTTTPVYLHISVASDNALKQIDGLKYKVRAESMQDGIQLNGNSQNVQFKDVTIKVRGKMSVEL